MIEYIVPNNPDDRIMKKASTALKEGEVLVIPTDTNWVLVCDPFARGGLEKMHKLKGDNKDKHYAVLCSSISMATEIAHISDGAFRQIRNKIPGHYTFVFKATKKMTKAVKASKTDHEVGIRFVPDDFINKFIDFHGGVIASTNLTKDMLAIGEQDEIYSYLIEEALGPHLGLIIDPGEYNFAGPSTMIRMIDDEIEMMREGAGDPKAFGL